MPTEHEADQMSPSAKVGTMHLGHEPGDIAAASSEHAGGQASGVQLPRRRGGAPEHEAQK